MRKTTILSVAFAAVCLVLLVIAPASALKIDFESGTNSDAIGTIDGVTFSTIDGFDLYYASILDDDWAFKSNNGLVNDPWRYYISGNVAAICPDSNFAWIGFDDPISYCNLGYSSEFQFIVEAYADDKTTMLVSASGGPNWVEQGVGYLAYLPVDHTGISWLKVYSDQGDYPVEGKWVIDDITVRDPVDPAVPEPATWLVLAMGLGGVLARVKLRRKI